MEHKLQFTQVDPLFNENSFKGVVSLKYPLLFENL